MGNIYWGTQRVSGYPTPTPPMNKTTPCELGMQVSLQWIISGPLPIDISHTKVRVDNSLM